MSLRVPLPGVGPDNLILVDSATVYVLTANQLQFKLVSSANCILQLVCSHSNTICQMQTGCKHAALALQDRCKIY